MYPQENFKDLIAFFAKLYAKHLLELNRHRT